MDQDRVHRLFTYSDGVLVWNPRPLSDFASKGSWSTWHSRFANKTAGGVKTNGYVYIQCDGKRHLEHRLVWLYHNGYLPPDSVDHINRKREDNRIENLRLATTRQNAENTRQNRSGYPGVHWSARRSKWVAAAKVKGKTVDLGGHERVEDAVHAREYFLARLENHQPFSVSK